MSMPIFVHDYKNKKRHNMKLEIEIKAEQMDWKSLITKINEAIEEETTNLSSVGLSFSEDDETD
jgi:hypothetical protein